MKNYLKATISVLLMIFTLINSAACSEILFGKDYGPYHHGTVITVPSEIIELNGTIYTCYDGLLYVAEDGKLTPAYYDGKTICCTDVETDGERLFVSTRMLKSGLSVYSADFDYYETLSDKKVRSVLIYGKKLYYFGAVSDVYSLYCYDLDTKEEVTLTDDFRNKTYSVDGKTIYSNLEGQLYWIDRLDCLDQAKGNTLDCYMGYDITTVDRSELGFCYNENVGIIRAKKGLVELEYNGQNLSFIYSDRSYLFNKIVVNGNKLYFALVDYKYNDECNFDFCICHINQSNLIAFDFETQSFNTIKNLPENSYFISFGCGFISYYSDGKVIRDTEVISEVNKIEPYGSYLQKGTASRGWDTSVSRSVFYDTGANFYYNYDDKSAYLKDEY